MIVDAADVFTEAGPSYVEEGSALNRDLSYSNVRTSIPMSCRGRLERTA